MEVKEYKDPKEYLHKVEPLLMKQEAMNNLPLGIAERLKKQPAEADLITIENGGEVVYTLLHTMRNQWVLPACDTDQSVIEMAACYLYDNGYPVDGIVGKAEGAAVFKDACSKKSKRTSYIHMKQLVYRLDQLEQIHVNGGKLKVAEESDKALIAEWLRFFGREAGERSIMEDAETLAEHMVKSGSMHLWIVNGTPVSMVNQSRSTKHGATVNAVYTPDEYKRKGYATQAVWALTEKLLEQGYRFCSLYTDAENPTSNSIYKKIGYYPIGESVVYRFSRE
ncbi:GNAT family N-acetyltransferase [Thalassobacillus devorans]|uniref:GNAT family N-acetyltransferase n=1 Tax=Thalassobacillus devorans TaxID=279813 RepID=UPI000A1C9CC6|nr:GNAT family N-acetyltransferase [Thalassobacillus devorans]